MTVTNSSIEFKWDCAHGLIDHSVTLVEGMMNEQGVVISEAGLESPDQPRPVLQADFSGVVSGDDFPIQITIYENHSVTSKIYRLKFGQDVQLVQCL